MVMALSADDATLMVAMPSYPTGGVGRMDATTLALTGTLGLPAMSTCQAAAYR